MHRYEAKLQIIGTQQDAPEPSGEPVEFRIMLESPLSGLVSASYPVLKGEAASMAWPQGAAYVSFPVQKDTSTNVGLHSWRVTAEPGRVPGLLQVGYWANVAEPSILPDVEDEYELGNGGWITPDLDVGEYDSSVEGWTTPWVLVGLRWFPAHWRRLLV